MPQSPDHHCPPEGSTPSDWRELMQVALDSMPTPDFRLEDMIDRIERDR